MPEIILPEKHVVKNSMKNGLPGRFDLAYPASRPYFPHTRPSSKFYLYFLFLSVLVAGRFTK